MRFRWRQPHVFVATGLFVVAGACASQPDKAAAAADLASDQSHADASPAQPADADAAAPTDAAAPSDASSPDVATPPPDVAVADAATATAAADGGAASTDGLAADAGLACPQPCTTAEPCFAATCDGASGKCVLSIKADGAACDDDVPCTTGEACTGGKCKGGALSPSCGCLSDADCKAKDDDKWCNGVQYCDKSLANWACKINPATVFDCPPPADGCHVAKCVEPGQPGGDTAQAKCAVELAADGTPCEDGKPQTVGDTCKQGSCIAGTQIALCETDVECGKYEDGNLCNGTLFCNKAKKECQINPKTIVQCPTVDNTACAVNQCQSKTGLCELSAVGEGKTCDDGNVCTVGEVCKAGKCLASADTCQCKKDADCAAQEDGNACNGTLYCDLVSHVCVVNPATVVVCQSVFDTTCSHNLCDKKTGKCAMTAVAEDLACDDGVGCSVGEVCKAGKCTASADTCQCKKDVDCAGYEDGDFCNGVLFCNKLKGACEVNPATVIVCPTGADGPCQKTACVPATGKCATKPAWTGAKCNADGNPCTVNDYCEQGNCVAGVLACECQTDADCAGKAGGNLCAGTFVCDMATKQCKAVGAVQCDTSKDNPCATTACNPLTGKCQTAVAPNGDVCGPNNYCAGPQLCTAGVCASGAALSCDDADQCTADSCDFAKGGCQHVASDGGGCNDGTVCTTNDLCSQGNCVGTTLPCNDDEPCTTDVCKPLTGCAYFPTSAKPCDDGNPCTVGDACATGKCAPGKGTADCDDGNPCSDDTCTAKLGCAHQAQVGTLCDDGDPCTTDTLCVAGTCKGVAAVCDDGDPCTADKCAALVGCQATPLADGATCSDGDLCTTGDSCKQGACQGPQVDCSDGDSCTTDACKAGKCLHTAVKGGCDDGSNCTGGDTCVAGKCVGSPINCDDQNPCTADSCDKGVGCQHAASPGPPCSDQDPCTLADVCTATGAGSVDCKGTPLSCDDFNGCTADICKLGTCQSVPDAKLDGQPCDDGSQCTSQDFCIKGACQGVVTSCSGGTPCTIASCHPLLGCKYTPRTGTCEDDNACTGTGECVGTNCVTVAKVCADGNPCTDDACNPKTGGCLFAPNSAPCDDSNPCTQPDTCSSGGCAGKPADVALLCDDKNLCTVESCTKAQGCIQTPVVGSCSDGDFCNGLEICVGAKCTAAAKLPCDDGDPCSNDGCDAKAQACAYTAQPDGQICDDGEPCTAKTACKSGKCVGVPLLCDDGNQCTIDSCVATKGCKFKSREETCVAGQPCDLACDDNNACTVGEACGASACQGSKPLVCDDGSLCTADSCDTKKGCLFVALGEGAACGAGPASCGVQGICKSGACVGEDIRPVTVAKFGPPDAVCRGVSADGMQGWLVAGEAPGAGGPSPLLVRLWPTAKVAWQTTLAGVTGRYSAIELYSASTAVAVGVRTAGTAGGLDGFAVQLGTDGKPGSLLDFATTADETLEAVTALGNGVLVVAGSRDSATSMRQGLFVKLDANFKVVWQKSYGTLIDDGVTALAKRPGGGVVFAGQVGKNGGWIGALDDDGKLLWESQPDNPKGFELFSVAVLGDGSVAAAGRSGGDAIVVRASALGVSQPSLTAPSKVFGALVPMANGSIALGGHSGGTVQAQLVSKIGVLGPTDLRWQRDLGLSGSAIAVRELSADGVQVFSSTCGTWRSDAFGNLDCATSGSCAFKPWSTCEDNSLCTPADECKKGQCLHPSPVQCSTKEPCKQSTCQAATGTCKVDNAFEGQPCAGQDDVPCLIKGTCAAGTCNGWGLEFWEYRMGNAEAQDLITLPDNTLGVVRQPQIQTDNGQCCYWWGNTSRQLDIVHSGGQVLSSFDLPGNSNVVARKNGGFLVGSASGGYAGLSLLDAKGASVKDFTGYSDPNDGWPHCEGPGVVAEEEDGKFGYVVAAFRCEGASATNCRYLEVYRIDLASGAKQITKITDAWRFYPERIVGLPGGGALLVTQQLDIDPGWAGNPWENPPYTAKRRMVRIGANAKVVWSKTIAEDVEESDGGVTWTPEGPVAVATRTEIIASTPIQFLMVRAFDTEGSLRWQSKLFPDTQGLWHEPSYAAGRILIAGRSGPYQLAIGWKTVLLELDLQGNVLLDSRWYDNYRAEYNQSGLANLGSGEPNAVCEHCWGDCMGCDGLRDLKRIITRWVRLPSGGIVGIDNSPGRLVRVHDFGMAKCEQAGKCLALHWSDCDDSKPCTADWCAASSGCKSQVFDDGALCSDGVACTVGDACSQGSCVGGAKAVAGIPCDDGVACTQGSSCSAAGVCMSGPAVCN